MYETSIKGDYVIFEYLDLAYISYIKILIDNKEDIIKNINEDCLDKIANIIYIKTGNKIDDNKDKNNVINEIKNGYLTNLNDIFNTIKKNKKPEVLFEEIENFTKNIIGYKITEATRVEKYLDKFKNEKNSKNARKLIRAIQQDFQKVKNNNSFQNEMKSVFEKIEAIANQLDEKMTPGK